MSTITLLSVIFLSIILHPPNVQEIVLIVLAVSWKLLSYITTDCMQLDPYIPTSIYMYICIHSEWTFDEMFRHTNQIKTLPPQTNTNQNAIVSI